MRQRVQVLILTHKYGDNVSVHADERSVQAVLVEFAREYWADVADKVDWTPTTDGELVEAYFNNHDVDSYATYDCEVEA